MEAKIKAVLDYLGQLKESEIDRVLKYVSELAEIGAQSEQRPCCPRCGAARVIKYGQKEKRQRFLCHGCKRTFSLTTNTVMEHSHYDRCVWGEFIRDTVYGVSLDKSAQRLGSSHQTAFNMRHKLLLALEQMHFASELPEYADIEAQYLDEETKLRQYREECKDEAFTLFSKWFYHLWD